MIALADLAGVWPLEKVTGALTKLADIATDKALKFHVGREIARGKLPGATEDDIATAGGAFALAMGKMGAGELNYSSDIDLIMLFDETRYDDDDYHDARASLIRAVRKMSSMLSENTADGYVFRTDLRLRPDPSVTPVIISTDAAERYYESLGRTWERAAHIKARTCAGDIVAGDRYLDVLRPFVYRKHLDFAAIQDAHDMRLRIREHKGLGGPITLPGHDMKLGRGGIREIEFFTQTRQLIAGGRDPDLRCRDTVGGLAALAAKGWTVTGVDVSQTALDIAADRARTVGLADRITFERHTLPETFPDGSFDLVSALFFQSPMAFDRARVLELAARATAPGGLLVIAAHNTAPRWRMADHDHRPAFPTPEEDRAATAKSGHVWREIEVGLSDREVTGPDGEIDTVKDSHVILERVS